MVGVTAAGLLKKIVFYTITHMYRTNDANVTGEHMR